MAEDDLNKQDMVLMVSHYDAKSLRSLCLSKRRRRMKELEKKQFIPKPGKVNVAESEVERLTKIIIRLNALIGDTAELHKKVTHPSPRLPPLSKTNFQE